MDGHRSLSTAPLFRSHSRAAAWLSRVAAGSVLAVLSFLVLAPLWAIAARAMTDTAAVGELARSARIHRILLFTVEQTAISVMLALAVGIPVAILTCWRVPLGRVASTLTTATFVLPTMVVAAAWQALEFPHGIVAITTAHAYFNVSVVVRFVTDAFARIPNERFLMARTLGAKPFAVTRLVVLPGVRRAIAAAAGIVAAFSATSLGIVTALAAQRQGTIETEILRRAGSIDTVPSAAWLGILQAVLITPILIAVARQRSLVGSRAGDSEMLRLGSRGRRCGSVMLGAVIVLWCVPLVQLLRVANWTELDRIAVAVSGGTTVDAVLGSLRAAAIATPLAVLAAAAVVVIHSRIAQVVRGFSLLALGVSPALLGLGMLLAYRLGPLDLRTSPLIIAIAQALVALPFCIRLLADAHASIPTDRIAIARAFGCSRPALFRLVEWPAMARTALSAAGFAAVIALGDFSATTFLARPDQTTLPLLIQQSFARPGTAARATGIAYACILLGLCAVMFGLSHMPSRDRLRGSA